MTSRRRADGIARRLAFPLFTAGVLAAFAAASNACGGESDPPPVSVEVPPPGIRPVPREAGTSPTPTDGGLRDTGGPLPPQTTAPEVDFGTVAAGTSVTLAVPPNALGFNVVVTGDTDDDVGIEKITSPAGEVVLRDHIVAGGTFETSLGTGIAAASVPQNEMASATSYPVAPGAWSIQVSSRTSRPVAVKARIQISGDGTFSGGALGMHVYIPKGLRIEDPDTSHVVSAASAPTDRAIDARLGSFYDALAQTLGISRGAVTFHDVDGGFVKISTEGTLAEGFAVSKGIVPDGEQTVHVLLTNDLDFGEGTWGIASGIPGAATRSGTHASGVALAVTPDTYADIDGLALLHEVGHFLGLNHTTEFVGGFVDPLADTPNCAGVIDISRPQTLDRCPDNDNLMFPTLWVAKVRTSDAQKRIFRGSPAYKAFVGANVIDAGTVDGSVLDATTDASASDATTDAEGGAGDGAVSFTVPPRRSLFTRSGRDLVEVERFVAAGLCGSTPARARLGIDDLVARLGDDRARAELTRIATDPELAGPIRMRAKKMLVQKPAKK